MARRESPKGWEYVVPRTVLVLGAGASKPYGFPLGPELRDAVCGLSTVEAMGLFSELGFHYSELEQFRKELRTSGYSSVDWFLEMRPEYASIGKAAIACCLIPFEHHARLFPPSAPKEHWYELLVNQLDDPLPLGEMGERGVAVLTFNYDRSLEHYLFKVLSTRRRSDAQAVEELRKLQIVHLHGTLGAYPSLQEGGREYRPDLTPESVNIAREQVVVVGEADDSTPEFVRARDLVAQASRIIFLGFGFHRASLARLGFGAESKDREKLVTGTTWKLPAPAWEFVSQYIFSSGSKRNAQSAYRFMVESGGVAPTLLPVWE